jgi:hypothetical protein
MNNIDERESRLSEALTALNRADALKMGTSPRVQAVLVAEVRSRAAARRRSYFLTLATAASLVLVVSASIWWMRAAVPFSPVFGSTVASREVVTDFLPLPFSSVPTSTTHVVRLEVPRSALASFGLGSFEAVDPSASTTVLADVLIGDDGLARAVRFVRSASHQE